MVIARKQTLVQLSDDLLAALDREAARRHVSRSALIREAVESHLHPAYDAAIARRYAEGYRRFPEQEWELRWAKRSGLETLEEESW